MNHTWTQNDIDILRKYSGIMSVSDLAVLFKTSNNSVSQKLSSLRRDETARIGNGDINEVESSLLSGSQKKLKYSNEEVLLVSKYPSFTEFYIEYRKRFPNSNRTVTALQSFYTHHRHISVFLSKEENQKYLQKPIEPDIKHTADDYIPLAELNIKRAKIIRTAILEMGVGFGNKIDLSALYNTVKESTFKSKSTFEAFIKGYGAYKIGEHRKLIDDIIVKRDGDIVFIGGNVDIKQSGSVKRDSLPDVGEILIKVLHSSVEQKQIMKENITQNERFEKQISELIEQSKITNANLTNLLQTQLDTLKLFTNIQNNKKQP